MPRLGPTSVSTIPKREWTQLSTGSWSYSFHRLIRCAAHGFDGTPHFSVWANIVGTPKLFVPPRTMGKSRCLEPGTIARSGRTYSWSQSTIAKFYAGSASLSKSRRLEPEHYRQILRGLRVALKIQVPGARALSPNSPRALPVEKSTCLEAEQYREFEKSTCLEAEHYREFFRELCSDCMYGEAVPVFCPGRVVVHYFARYRVVVLR